MTSLLGKEPVTANTVQEHTSLGNRNKRRAQHKENLSTLHRPGVGVGRKRRNRSTLQLGSRHFQRDTEGQSPAPRYLRSGPKGAVFTEEN